MTSGAPQATLLLRVIAAASLAALVLARPAAGDQAVLQALKDNTIFSQSNSLSDGKGTGLFAGVTGGSAKRRALLAFDVAAAIPAVATITSAQLTLRVTMSNAGSQTMALHRLLADWGEGTSNSNEMGGGMGAPAATGDATWHFRFFDSDTWGSDGGDFVAATSAVKQALDSGPVTWGSTPQMVADVQSWLDAPATNFGWIVRGNEAANGTSKRFASRETGTAANRPTLTIVFDPPGGGATATATVTSASTASATPSPTMPAPTATGTATLTHTRTVTVTPAATSAATATATDTVAPTTQPTSTATPTLSPSVVGTATATTTPSASPTVSAAPTDSPPPTPTAAATSTATAAPSATASAEVATPTATATPPVVSCVSDCDGSGTVTINELILGVNIALGSQPITACLAFDPSGNGSVEINELIAAVNNALGGCE